MSNERSPKLPIDPKFLESRLPSKPVFGQSIRERIESMGRDMGIHETNLQRFRYKLEDFAREMFEAGRNSKGV